MLPSPRSFWVSPSSFWVLPNLSPPPCRWSCFPFLLCWMVLPSSFSPVWVVLLFLLLVVLPCSSFMVVLSPPRPFWVVLLGLFLLLVVLPCSSSSFRWCCSLHLPCVPPWSGAAAGVPEMDRPPQGKRTENSTTRKNEWRKQHNPKEGGEEKGKQQHPHFPVANRAEKGHLTRTRGCPPGCGPISPNFVWPFFSKMYKMCSTRFENYPTNGA